MYINFSICIYIYIYVYINTYVNIYIHAYTHIYKQYPHTYQAGNEGLSDQEATLIPYQ
jgi:hypothetical protein